MYRVSPCSKRKSASPIRNVLTCWFMGAISIYSAMEILLYIPHVTRPANVPVPIYISRQSPVTRTDQYQIVRQGADKNRCGLASRSYLFPSVHIL